MPPDLIVHYGKAPVTEVVLGVQFSENAVDLDVLAEFSRQMRDSFPKREQHEPLPPSREDLSPAPSAAVPTFQLMQQFPFPRTWFLSPEGHRLLQLQADRLIFNWRKLDDEAQEYPHYENLRPVFEEALQELRAALEALGRPQPSINFAEVSYVNVAIVPGTRPGSRHPGLHRVLREISPPPEEVSVRRPEDQAYLARYRVPHWDHSHAQPRADAGRLYVNAQPAFRRRDSMPIYTLTITANLVPEMLDDRTVLRALDWGRESVVRSFDTLTEPEMHAAWERQEVAK